MTTTTTTTRTAAMLALFVILAAAAVGVAVQPGRDRQPAPGRPPGPPPAKILSREVAPMEYRLSAYRVGENIVIVATGANRTSGYTTALKLTSAEQGKAPEVMLSNIPPAPGTMAAQMITPFDVTAYVPAGPKVTKLTVTVAGRPESIEVKRISKLEPPEDEPEGE